MNRLRLWLFMALLLLAGAGNLYFLSRSLGARSLAGVDRELRGAAAQVNARARLLAADAGDLAEAAARAPAVAAGLAEAGVDPLAAAEDALRPAAAALKVDPANVLVAVAGPRGAQARVGPDAVPLPESAPFLDDPRRGGRHAGFARVGERLWMVSGVPAGRGGAVVVGLPIDAAFARAIHADADVDVTLVADHGKVGATTLPPEDALEVVGATGAPGRVGSVGRLGAVETSLPLPRVPVLFTSAPEWRTLAVPLDGARDAAVVLSVATAPVLAGVATWQWLVLLGLALLVLIGLVLGLLMTDGNGAPSIPRELLQAADRIRRGDFAARAPTLAGTAGVLAAALNRAAEAAHEAASRPAPAETPAEVSSTQPIFAAPPAEPVARRAPEPTEPEPSPEELAFAPAPEPVPSPADVPAPAAIASAAVEPPEPVVAEPTRDAGAQPDGESDLEPVLVSTAEEDEAHWRIVFEDFLRVRGQTGEPAVGVSYDRFRAKLQKNRDQLLQKFGCRTVRFQVYVKEGKAAVRATPVR